jgi:general stress protein 26
MLPHIAVPAAQPVRPIPGYGMPQEVALLLDWSFVQREMTASRHYWLATTREDGQPHVAPVWGLWHEDRFHFEGSPRTAWARDLAGDARVAVHLPKADRVVIVEGIARMIGDDEISDEEWHALDSQFQTKYAVSQGSPFRYVQPTKVLAWDGEDLQTMTRWLFAGS